MSKVFLVSYATDRFECVRRDLNSSAIEWGYQGNRLDTNYTSRAGAKCE